MPNSGECYNVSKEQIDSISLKLLKNMEREKYLPNIFVRLQKIETNQSLITVEIPDEISANRVQQNIKK